MANQRGSVLVLCYLLVAVLVSLGSAAIIRSFTEQRIAQRSLDLSGAFQLAEAGFDAAIDHLHAGDTSNVALTALGQGTHSATITQPNGFPSNQYRIQSTGQLHGISQSVEGVVQKTLISPFQWGLFGIEKVKVRGNVQTDSFNSSLGTYAATKGSNGDVGTNAVSAASVDVRGRAVINGDASVGRGGDPNSAIRVGGSAVITGNRFAASQTYQFPTPQPPDGSVNLGDLKLRAGEELVLPAGTYWYTSFRAEGGSQIRVSGPVTIYVSRKVKIGGRALVGEADDEDEDDGDEDEGVLGGPVTVASDRLNPTQLTIHVMGRDKVNVKGRALIHAALYAPNAKVKIGGRAELFGAVVARQMDLKGRARLHYDEALAAGGSQRAPYRVSVLSWQNL